VPSADEAPPSDGSAVASCHGQPVATARESDTVVRIAVPSPGADEAGADCADELQVRPNAPLRLRFLLDAAARRPVPVLATPS